MLLFKPEHIQPILNGRKTETRRLWKRRRARPLALHWCTTKLYDKDARFCRVRIVSCRREALGCITEEGAMREGYGCRAVFLDAFERINGTTPLDTIVYVVRFYKVASGEENNV